MPSSPLGRLLEGSAYGVLNEVLAEFREDDGYAQPNRYEVVLYPPTGTKGNQNLMNVFAETMQENTKEGITRTTGLRCSQIDLPGRDLEVVQDTNIYGPTREIVQGVTYADITATFQMSQDLKEKQFFETWQRLCYNPQTWAMQYYDSYVGSMDIYQLDKNNRRRYGVKLVECFPKNISSIGLDYAANDTLSIMPVTWSYRYWKSLVDEADLPKPLGDRVRDVLGNTVERQILSQIPKVLSRL